MRGEISAICRFSKLNPGANGHEQGGAVTLCIQLERLVLPAIIRLATSAYAGRC
jgi:hypothetical protein